jgi:hypothetical protein
MLLYYRDLIWSDVMMVINWIGFGEQHSWPDRGGIPIKIRTKDLPNRGLEHYFQTSLFSANRFELKLFNNNIFEIGVE